MSKGQTANKKKSTKKSGTKTSHANSTSFKKGNTIGEETRFKKGNTIGEETRVKPGDKLATVYKAEYPDMMLEYAKKEDVVLPSMEGWCMDNAVAIRTAYGWLETHPQFASAYDQLKLVQKQRLQERGLLNQYNSQIVKFLLENNHGMREKADSTVTYTVKMNQEIDEESN